MMTRDSSLHMSTYTLKVHTKALTFERGRPTLKDVDLKKRKKERKKKKRNEKQRSEKNGQNRNGTPSVYMEVKSSTTI